MARRHCCTSEHGDDESSAACWRYVGAAERRSASMVNPPKTDAGDLSATSALTDGLPRDSHWHREAAAIAARHWHRTLWLVAALMTIGFVVTFVPQFWAREWMSVRFAGWPLPFYMGAQGSILIDIGLIVIYALVQRRNDARYRADLQTLRRAHTDSLGLGDAAVSGMSGGAQGTASASSRMTSRAASAPTSR